MHGLLVKPRRVRRRAQVSRCCCASTAARTARTQHSFSFERELFAANGYAVLNVNYRGSNGRGEEYQKAIFADWGNKEVIDLLAGVDDVVAMRRRRSGSPRHRRLELRRHSHRLHDRDRRRASRRRSRGAGSALQLSMYGVDSTSTSTTTSSARRGSRRICGSSCHIRSSTPIASRRRRCSWAATRTSTCRVIGGEQMYQALRSLGVPTQLVVYPEPAPSAVAAELQLRSAAAVRGVV